MALTLRVVALSFVIGLSALWIGAAPRSLATAPATAQSADTTVQGDADCSGGVTIADATALLRDVAGAAAATCASAGDVQCDHVVDARDALALVRFDAGLGSAAPPCPAIGGERPPLQTSADLIEQALADQQIDYETSLLYRAYALYNDPRLPAEYRSIMPDLDDGTDLFATIAANDPAISEPTLDALAPFTARPNDPASVFNQPNAQAAPQGAGLQWWTVPAGGGKYRVWVKAATADEVTFLLNSWAGDVNLVAPELAKIINAPIPDEGAGGIDKDNGIDIYFVDVGSSDPRDAWCLIHPQDAACKFVGALGWARPTAPIAGNKASGFVMLDKRLSGNDLIATMAHELFHVSEFSYDYKETSFLKESMAEWGAFRVLDQLNYDQTPTFNWLPRLFKGLDDVPLTSEANLHAYEAWLYYYALELQAGTTQIGQQIWTDAWAPGVQGAKAVDDVYPFEVNFQKFATYNWNEPPADDYILNKQITNTAPLYLGQPENVTLDGVHSKKYEEPADVTWLTARHFQYMFEDDAVHSFVYHNKVVDEPHATVTALVKVGGEWSQQDWSDQQDVAFCRDKADENVQELVVIIANSDWQEERSRLNPSENPSLESSAAGCHGWQGTLSADVSYNHAKFKVTVENALFTEDPRDTNPDDRYSGYLLTSTGPVTWHVSGAWGPTACAASGELTLGPPDPNTPDGVVLGDIVIDHEEGDHSIAVAGGKNEATFTITCQGHPSELPWPALFITWDGGANEHHMLTNENGQQVAADTFFDPGPGPGYEATYTWHLTKVE